MSSTPRRRDRSGWLQRSSRERRLRIEAMEGRLLLSGNSLDWSTFGNDLSPAAYADEPTLSSNVTNNLVLTRVPGSVQSNFNVKLGADGDVYAPVGTALNSVTTVASQSSGTPQTTYSGGEGGYIDVYLSLIHI